MSQQQQLVSKARNSENVVDSQTNETLEQSQGAKISNNQQVNTAGRHLLRLLGLLLQALLLVLATSWRHLKQHNDDDDTRELRNGRASPELTTGSQLATTTTSESQRATLDATPIAEGEMVDEEQQQRNLNKSKKNLVQLTSRTTSTANSLKVAAGFDYQLVANELSSSLISEALELIRTHEEEREDKMREQVNQPEVSKGEDQVETISTVSCSSSSSLSQSSSNSSSSSSSTTSYEDFCGQQASELNLRQLRLSALEDVLVCGQQRHSTESARRLFNMLATPKDKQKCAPPTLKAGGGGGSLGSRSGEDEDEEEELCFQQNNNNYDDIYASDTCNNNNYDDYGTIKIIGGRTSASTDGHSYRGRTLVCSVSPVSQLGGGSGGSGSASVNGDATDEHLPAHSVDGDEIRHCRQAFRQNRRLIEAQAKALLLNNDQQQQRTLSRTSSMMTIDRSRWLDSLSRRQRLPDCSHCHKPLYPTDRMELDFTRSRLNIHRNCFKCQVCSTMLRLETYASIDAKLYCPAHTKCVAAVNISTHAPATQQC